MLNITGQLKIGRPLDCGMYSVKSAVTISSNETSLRPSEKEGFLVGLTLSLLMSYIYIYMELLLKPEILT
jgi:hypothetical protein